MSRPESDSAPGASRNNGRIAPEEKALCFKEAVVEGKPYSVFTTKEKWSLVIICGIAGMYRFVSVFFLVVSFWTSYRLKDNFQSSYSQYLLPGHSYVGE